MSSSKSTKIDEQQGFDDEQFKQNSMMNNDGDNESYETDHESDSDYQSGEINTLFMMRVVRQMLFVLDQKKQTICPISLSLRGFRWLSSCKSWRCF
eukprot:c25374_g1_i1.p1 GENE.c25374_g1_i1~~c25374_g1_i1.p1  ORF type:complete len:110 (+),score=4.53 c25374_g1_i1:43-330(+)